MHISPIQGIEDKVVGAYCDIMQHLLSTYLCQSSIIIQHT